MAVNLKSVLVSDAVDPLCVDLLKSHGVEVVCKFKLPKDELIRELQVKIYFSFSYLKRFDVVCFNGFLILLL